ncbi:MAG: hypothetical protein Q9181_004724 [Wetmoreana brouardii]
MRASLLYVASSVLALVAAQDKPNPFTLPPGFMITAGQATTITWQPTTGGTVSIRLRQGASSNLEEGTVIASHVDNNGKTTVTLPASTTRNSDYALEIVSDSDSGDVNYSAPFVVESKNTVDSVSSQATTAALTSPSAAATSAAATNTAATSAAATSAAVTSAAATSAAATSAAATTSAAAMSTKAGSSSMSTTSASTKSTMSTKTGSSTKTQSTSSPSSTSGSSSPSSSGSSESTATGASTTTAPSSGAMLLKVQGLLVAVLVGAAAAW